MYICDTFLLQRDFAQMHNVHVYRETSSGDLFCGKKNVVIFGSQNRETSISIYIYNTDVNPIQDQRATQVKGYCLVLYEHKRRQEVEFIRLCRHF